MGSSGFGGPVGVRAAFRLMQSVSIHTDGSCWPNPGGPGGWGAVLVIDGVRSELHGSLPAPQTNNRAEITAAIMALTSLTEPSNIDLYTDSQYLRTGAAVWRHAWAKRGWKRKTKASGWESIPNVDLWHQIVRLCELHRIRWHWVRGHDVCAENIRCDALAENARAGATS